MNARDDEVRADHVGGGGFRPGQRVGIGDGIGVGASGGVIDQDVNGAEFGRHLGSETLNLVPFGDGYDPDTTRAPPARNSSATGSSWEAGRVQMAMSAPSAAKTRAMARPTPRPATVTTAT